MGSRKTHFSQSIKRIATFASVLGAIGGIAVATALAQTTDFESLNQSIQQVGHGQDVVNEASQLPLQESVAKLASNTYSRSPKQLHSSARIIRPQPAFLPQAKQQATVNRRALVGQGRMISAGFRQEPGVLGSLPQDPGRTVLQRQDDPEDFFGDNQAVPTVPRNDTPVIPIPNTPQAGSRQEGELPPDVFQNPFDKERRPKPDQSTVEIPGELTPEVPRDPSNNDNDPSSNSNQQQNPNPFVLQNDENDDNRIDYQPGRGFNTTRSRSNVYRPPGSENNYQPDNGVYFVPAYDPIPGTQQPILAPPATMTPEHHSIQQPAWPNQYAPQQPQYQQPEYHLPPTPYTHPQQYAPAPMLEPQQQVYSSVVGPADCMACVEKGPMTPVRRGLLGKIQQDLKDDWGFGDYQSCMNAGNCGGCSSGLGSTCGSACGTKCPVFYIGFQATWNDAFDVANGQGTELELDDGTAFFFSLGRMNGRNLRTEIQLSFRNNDISSLLTPAGELPYTGQLQTFSGMANLYWEFIDFPAGRLKPYIGGGAGFMSVTSDLRLASDPSPSDDQSASSSSFAYQWMAGVNYKVSNHLDLYAEYRFVDAESFGISSSLDDFAGNFGYSANSVGGGLRWKF